MSLHRVVSALLCLWVLLGGVPSIAGAETAARSGSAVQSGRDNYVKIIPVHDALYRSVDLLYLELGLAPPSGSRPWSIDEWYRVLERVDRQRLSKTGLAGLEQIHRRLEQERGAHRVRGESYQLDLWLELALEAYGHTNLNDFTDESDWVYGYTRRSPAAKLALELQLHSWLYLYSDLEYSKNRYAYDAKTDTASSEKLYNKRLSSNLHLLDHLDFESPYRAFAAAGGDGWNMSFGRDLVRWGHGRTGNFVLNDHLDYHDRLRFVSYHDRLKVEATYLFLHHADFTTTREEPPPGIRMFLGHRLEYRPWPWLSLALTENVMYQHTTAEGTVLNPLYVFHNLNNRSMFNAIASAELEAAVRPGLTLLYQYSLYQARAPLEGASQPDAMAHLAGYRVARPLGQGYLFHELEGVYSDSYMYQRDLVDMKVLRRQFVHDYGFASHREFLGYPEGGDVVVLSGAIGFHRPQAFDLSFELLHLWRGEIGIDTEIQSSRDFDLDRQAPSGTVERTLGAGVELVWQPWRTLELIGRIDSVWVWNKDNTQRTVVQDLQYVLGARYRF